MKTPDRYDKMVDTAVGNVGGVQRFGITNAGAAALLRRQHAAYVKAVKRATQLAQKEGKP